ncbi:hypothetical protein Bbelb_327800 [Branchiostoma belcheri]|nr:hypothetical protein Bbelb_327800 [Branchiostoma belcheri]
MATGPAKRQTAAEDVGLKFKNTARRTSGLQGTKAPYLSVVKALYLSGVKAPWLSGIKTPYLSGIKVPYLSAVVSEGVHRCLVKALWPEVTLAKLFPARGDAVMRTSRVFAQEGRSGRGDIRMAGHVCVFTVELGGNGWGYGKDTTTKTAVESKVIGLWVILVRDVLTEHVRP